MVTVTETILFLEIRGEKDENEATMVQKIYRNLSSKKIHTLVTVETGTNVSVAFDSLKFLKNCKL